MISCYVLFAVAAAWAAPYPDDGEPITWTQPDGRELKLLVFGDEFYARTATPAGHTVVYDPADMAYYYAELSEDGMSLVPGEHLVGGPVPEGLPRHLGLPPAAVRALWEKRHAELAPNEDEEWAELVEARRAVEVGEPEFQKANPLAPRSGPGFAPVSGSVVGLTVLVQFPDDPETVEVHDPTPFPTTREKIERFCNEPGYLDDGNTGSIRDYFRDQSLNALDYTQVVTPLVTLPQPRNYYNFSDYPINATLRDGGLTGRLVLTDAIAELQAASFDFTGLTLNAGNRVVATNVLFAGGNSGVWPDGLWPHRWVVDPQVNIGTEEAPIYIYDYQITNAATPAVKIGTFVHESGHLLCGYPDLYDYGGESEGVGHHCLMGSGNHLNSGRTPAPINGYFKDVSGWSNVLEIAPTEYLVATLPSTGNAGYRIRKPGTPTEYFLIENRGDGDPWAQYVPDKGIVIWHVDENVSGNNDEQMTASQHYQVSVEQADGDFDLENNRNRGDGGDLYDSGTQAFSDDTTPGANWWDGTPSSVIVEVLDAPGAGMDVRFGSILPEIAVEQPPGDDLVDGVSVVGFSTPAIGVPVTQAFTIRNTGNSDLSGLAISISGPDRDEFSATALGETVLAADASLTFEVTFTPGSTAASTAVLHVASNDVDENPFDVVLSGVVRGLLASDGFENGMGGWTDAPGFDFNWTRHSVTTSSFATGPSGASEGIWYIFTESSSPNHPDKAAAVEKAFDLGGIINTTLFFDYHMYGDTMGTLSLDVHDGELWHKDVWSLSGGQQVGDRDPWRQAEVDLSAYNHNPDVRLRFRGTTSSSWTSDMAVDRIELHGLRLEYPLLYIAGAGGTISGSASQTVLHGSDATPVQAVPDTNFRFVDWSDGSTANPRTDLAVTGAITVTANFEQNFPPVFGGYSIGVDEGGTAVVSLAKLLAGVTDPEGHRFSVTSAEDETTKGTVTLGPDSITYETPIGISGSDSFRVTVTDEFGAATTAPVTVTIRPAAGSDGSLLRNPPSVTINGSSQAEIRFHGIPGRTYRVQRSTDLNLWTDIGTVAAAANGEVFHTDTDPPEGSAFYRLAR